MVVKVLGMFIIISGNFWEWNYFDHHKEDGSISPVDLNYENSYKLVQGILIYIV